MKREDPGRSAHVILRDWNWPDGSMRASQRVECATAASPARPVDPRMEWTTPHGTVEAGCAVNSGRPMRLHGPM